MYRFVKNNAWNFQQKNQLTKKLWWLELLNYNDLSPSGKGVGGGALNWN